MFDVIYSSYIRSLGGNIFSEKLLEQKRYFVDTLPNGIDPIRKVANKVPEAKIIIMKRNLESLLFSNAARMTSYQGEVQVDN